MVLGETYNSSSREVKSNATEMFKSHLMSHPSKNDAHEARIFFAFYSDKIHTKRFRLGNRSEGREIDENVLS